MSYVHTVPVVSVPYTVARLVRGGAEIALAAWLFPSAAVLCIVQYSGRA